LAVSAGDAFLDIHPKLATGFGPKLAQQVQRPATNAGEQAAHHFGRRFATGLKVAGVAAGVGLAVGVRAALRGVLTTTKAASDLNETINKSNVIFEGSAKSIQKWSRGTAQSMGLSRNEALTNASAFGDMFRQLGIGLPTTAKMSTRLVGLASDLASFSNADISQVLEAQQAAFRGEYDSLQRFIPAINAARVQQVALAQTHKKSATDLTAAEKAQATYTIMLHDSVRAQGDFGRTSDQLANQQRIQSALWENLKTKIGQGFLPAQLAVTRALTSKVLPALGVLVNNYGPKVGAVVSRWAISFAKVIPTSKDLGLGLSALSAAFHGEGITTSSDKFVGKMERLGVTGRKVVDMAKGLGPQLSDIGDRLSRIWRQSRIAGPGLGEVHAHGDRLAGTLAVVSPLLGSVAHGSHLLGSALAVAAPILDVLARNMHNIVPWLPQILLGFLAFRAVKGVLGPVRELGEMVRNFTTPALAIATLAQARSQRALAVAMREQGVASRGAAVAQGESNVAQNAGVLASARARVATLLQAVAQRAVAAATTVWAAATRVLGLAMKGSLGPIGIVITLIAAVASGLIYAYKHSETFRRIVDGVWSGVKKAVGAAVNFILGLLRGWLDMQFEVVAGILHVMGKLPGPMGAPFRHAEDAVRKAKKTVDDQIGKIQKRVNTLTGKDIPIKARTSVEIAKSVRTYLAAANVPGFRAKGGLTRLGETAIVGEEGPELVKFTRPAYVYTATETRGILARGLVAGGSVGEALTNRFYNPTIRQTGRIGQSMADVAAAVFSKIATIPSGGGGAGSGLAMKVAQWTISALRRPLGEVAAWFRRLMFESGGNPRAINRVDSNWRAGHPSVGIAQVIRGTFAANAGRFRGVGPFAYGVSMNPYANSFAGAHYAIGRYGSLHAVDPRMRHAGYDLGGGLRPGMTMAWNGTGKTEPLGFDYARLAAAVARGGISPTQLADAIVKAMRERPPVVHVDDIHAALLRKKHTTMGGMSLGLS
jgi:hypothetical protein